MEYEGTATIEKGDHRPVLVTYNYYVKVGGKHVVTEFIYHQGQQDFNTRVIQMNLVDHKGKNNISIDRSFDHVTFVCNILIFSSITLYTDWF